LLGIDVSDRLKDRRCQRAHLPAAADHERHPILRPLEIVLVDLRPRIDIEAIMTNMDRPPTISTQGAPGNAKRKQ